MRRNKKQLRFHRAGIILMTWISFRSTFTRKLACERRRISGCRLSPPKTNGDAFHPPHHLHRSYTWKKHTSFKLPVSVRSKCSFQPRTNVSHHSASRFNQRRTRHRPKVRRRQATAGNTSAFAGYSETLFERKTTSNWFQIKLT